MINKLRKAKDLLRKARIELNRYKTTKNFTFSSQASEKCWVACNLIIEHKLNIELRTGSIKRILPFATQVGMVEITLKCHNLHVYHYEGSQGFSEDDLIFFIESAIEELNKLT